MIRFITAVAMLLSSQAFAHVAKGEYAGKDQNGKPCSFKVGETWFADEIEHPLTERIEITKIVFVDITPKFNLWQVGHPPVVNIEGGLVRFNHDIFQDIIPTSYGAVSITILKEKEESEIGKPVGLIYMEDNYKNKAESKKITCLI